MMEAKTDIPWLDDLLLKCPVLKKSDIDFIIHVYFRIKQITVKRQNSEFETTASKARACEIKEMADSMKDKFKLVVKMLKENSTSKRRFLKNFPEWRGYRDMNVLHLKNIANSIEAEKKKFQENKVAGSVLSIVGGLICLAAGGGMLRLLGTAVMGVGTATAAIFIPDEEKKSLTKNIDKAKRIMELEEKQLKFLVEFLDDAISLQNAMIDIKFVGENDGLIDKFKNVFKKSLNYTQKRKEIQMILDSLNIPEQWREDIADVVGILITCYMLLDRCGSLFREAAKSYEKLLSGASIVHSVYLGIHSAVKCSQLTTNQKGKIRTGIFLDIIHILVVASQDPKSVEAEEIRKAAAQLEKEADQLERMYDKMKYDDKSDDNEGMMTTNSMIRHY